ncbi:Cold-shock DNA-binding domain-containing protein [Ditylenchus destructor]|nr:Cold-shock DNA-binding domain-containing protein [Ditylenchus destructor]
MDSVPKNNASETAAAQPEPAQNNGKGEGGKRYNIPDKPIMQARNKTGVVKWFSFKNGYGFITVDEDGDDIFVHRSEFIREGAREVFYHVDVGDKLEFDIINRAKGREAVAVTGPNGVRIPGSPANYSRRGGQGRINRNRRQNHEDQFVDAEEHHDEDAENKPPNGEAKKRGGRGGGGRRRNASNEENGQQQGSGGDNAGEGNNKSGSNRRVRKNTGRRGRGPRNADSNAQEDKQQDKKE